MMQKEMAPKYEALDNALNELMDTNVAKGDAEELKLGIFLIIALFHVLPNYHGITLK